MENQAKTIKITDPRKPNSPEHSNPWLILVIDDVQSVLDVTCSVLKNLEFEGRGVHLQCAKSAQEAKELYLRYSNPAVILVDCVMETDTAGLDFVEFIRNEQKNHKTQVILRTGQPGTAPEHEVLEKHHINDYLAKTELSSAKLKSRVTAYLRNYHTMSLLADSVQQPEAMEPNLLDYTLACSVASEMKSPLAQINHNLQRIRETVPDLLKSEPDITLLDRLYRNLDNSQYAVKYSEKMINFLLKEGKNSINNSDSLIYLSAQQLTQQTVNHYLDNNPNYRDKVTIEQKDDFLLCISGKCYSEIISVLLNRAFDYQSDYPDLTVTISLQADTGCHKVRIKDTGPALSPEQQQGLFEIDNIYEPEAENESEPSLAYCKRSMNSFNGSINCYSAEGEGTEFVLSFPVVLPIADEHDEFNYIPQPRLFSKGILVGKTILLVTDDNNNIASALNGLGVNTVKALDRKQALDIVKNISCDLIITGSTMPVVDRLEFVRAVRALEGQNKLTNKTTAAPILALIEQQNSALAKACFQAGIDALVFMPLEKNELVNILVQQFNFTHAEVE